MYPPFSYGYKWQLGNMPQLQPEVMIVNGAYQNRRQPAAVCAEHIGIDLVANERHLRGRKAVLLFCGTDAALERLEREGLDTTTERELLAALWMDGAALATPRTEETKRV